MPKKKLTKIQVKRKLKTLYFAVYDLMLDKMGHTNSDVPMSLPKLMDIWKFWTATAKRIK